MKQFTFLLASLLSVVWLSDAIAFDVDQKPVVVDSLIQELASDDFEKRTNAQKTLYNLPLNAEPLLRKTLRTSTDSEVRARLTSVLAHFQKRRIAQRMKTTVDNVRSIKGRSSVKGLDVVLSIQRAYRIDHPKTAILLVRNTSNKSLFEISGPLEESRGGQRDAITLKPGKEQSFTIAHFSKRITTCLNRVVYFANQAGQQAKAVEGVVGIVRFTGLSFNTRWKQTGDTLFKIKFDDFQAEIKTVSDETRAKIASTIVDEAKKTATAGRGRPVSAKERISLGIERDTFENRLYISRDQHSPKQLASVIEQFPNDYTKWALLDKRRGEPAIRSFVLSQLARGNRHAVKFLTESKLITSIALLADGKAKSAAQADRLAKFASLKPFLSSKQAFADALYKGAAKHNSRLTKLDQGQRPSNEEHQTCFQFAEVHQLAQLNDKRMQSLAIDWVSRLNDVRGIATKPLIDIADLVRDKQMLPFLAVTLDDKANVYGSLQLREGRPTMALFNQRACDMAAIVISDWLDLSIRGLLVKKAKRTSLAPQEQRDDYLNELKKKVAQSIK